MAHGFRGSSSQLLSTIALSSRAEHHEEEVGGAEMLDRQKEKADRKKPAPQ